MLIKTKALNKHLLILTLSQIKITNIATNNYFINVNYFTDPFNEK